MMIRITSYNVCYTKLLRIRGGATPDGGRRAGFRHALGRDEAVVSSRARRPSPGPGPGTPGRA